MASAACRASPGSSGRVMRCSTMPACRRALAGIMRASLGEGDDDEPFALEFLRGLAEPPGVVDQFADVVLAGERADVVDGFEDAAVAVVEDGADLQVGVGPCDAGGGAFAADIDADPDVLGAHGRADVQTAACSCCERCAIQGRLFRAALTPRRRRRRRSAGAARPRAPAPSPSPCGPSPARGSPSPPRGRARPSGRSPTGAGDVAPRDPPRTRVAQLDRVLADPQRGRRQPLAEVGGLLLGLDPGEPRVERRDQAVDRPRPEGRREVRAGVERRLAVLRDEGVEVDEPRDAAGHAVRGAGDRHAAVGVPDDHDAIAAGALDRLDHRADVVAERRPGVRHAGQRGRVDDVPGRLERRAHRIPRPAAGARPVDQDERRRLPCRARAAKSAGLRRQGLPDVRRELLHRDVGALLLPVLRAAHGVRDAVGHVGVVDDDQAGVALVEDLAQHLEVVAVHAAAGVPGGRAQRRSGAAADGERAQEPHGREQGHDGARREPPAEPHRGTVAGGSSCFFSMCTLPDSSLTTTAASNACDVATWS